MAGGEGAGTFFYILEVGGCSNGCFCLLPHSIEAKGVGGGGLVDGEVTARRIGGAGAGVGTVSGSGESIAPAEEFVPFTRRGLAGDRDVLVVRRCAGVGWHIRDNAVVISNTIRIAGGTGGCGAYHTTQNHGKRRECRYDNLVDIGEVFHVLAFLLIIM